VEKGRRVGEQQKQLSENLVEMNARVQGEIKRNLTPACANFVEQLHAIRSMVLVKNGQRFLRQNSQHMHRLTSAVL